MAFINEKKKEVQVKIVYYGPGRGGKTTNLEYVFSKLNPQAKSKMVSLKTDGDRTLFFDFLPIDVGKIMGYDIRIQLYTVPGQIKYASTRRLVLQGVDGVVFVADSMAVRRKQNLISLKNLQEDLLTYKKSIFKIPLLLQYNKVDLIEEGIPVIPLAILDKDLNSKLKAPSIQASALKGTNVLKTMMKIIALALPSIEKNLQ
jgi:mutual gliding-motility protein MglA